MSTLDREFNSGSAPAKPVRSSEGKDSFHVRIDVRPYVGAGEKKYYANPLARLVKAVTDIERALAELDGGFYNASTGDISRDRESVTLHYFLSPREAEAVRKMQGIQDVTQFRYFPMGAILPYNPERHPHL